METVKLPLELVEKIRDKVVTEDKIIEFVIDAIEEKLGK